MPDIRSSTGPRDVSTRGRYSRLVISVITPSRISLNVSDVNFTYELFEVDQELRNGIPAGPFVSDQVLVGSVADPQISAIHDTTIEDGLL
jgi:hypothetical protein